MLWVEHLAMEHIILDFKQFLMDICYSVDLLAILSYGFVVVIEIYWGFLAIEHILLYIDIFLTYIWSL